jgi:hypothetical protein
MIIAITTASTKAPDNDETTMMITLPVCPFPLSPEIKLASVGTLSKLAILVVDPYSK